MTPPTGMLVLLFASVGCTGLALASGRDYGDAYRIASPVGDAATGGVAMSRRTSQLKYLELTSLLTPSDTGEQWIMVALNSPLGRVLSFHATTFGVRYTSSLETFEDAAGRYAGSGTELSLAQWGVTSGVLAALVSSATFQLNGGLDVRGTRVYLPASATTGAGLLPAIECFWSPHREIGLASWIVSGPFGKAGPSPYVAWNDIGGALSIPSRFGASVFDRWEFGLQVEATGDRVAEERAGLRLVGNEALARFPFALSLGLRSRIAGARVWEPTAGLQATKEIRPSLALEVAYAWVASEAVGARHSMALRLRFGTASTVPEDRLREGG